MKNIRYVSKPVTHNEKASVGFLKMDSSCSDIICMGEGAYVIIYSKDVKYLSLLEKMLLIIELWNRNGPE